MPEVQRHLDVHPLLELERKAELWKRQYRLLLDSVSDAVFTEDDGGGLISANAAAERLSGYTGEELLGMNMSELLPGFCDPALEALESPANFEQHFSAAAELQARDGMRKPVNVHATVLRDPQCPLLVQYIVRDAAPDKRPQEAGHAETRFRLMAKNLTEMVLAYDMDRRLTYANAAAETLTGYSVSELERQQFICWVHPEDRGRMLDHWEHLFQAKSFYEEEYRLLTKDGRMKWVAASWGPILDDAGRQVGVQGRERDVTERRMAEETLRQSEHSLRINEERYRNLFENSPFAMWEEDFSPVKAYLDALADRGITDFREYFAAHRDALVECVRGVRILDVNRAARDFYGVRDKEELLGDLNAFFDETAYEVFAEELWTLAKGGSIFRSEFRTRTVRGDERTVSMIVSLVPTPDRDWSRVIVSFFDITDRKRLDEQLLQSQKLESLGRLAGGIAHDFNNLLTVINGYSELLLRGMEPQNPLHRGLAEIQNAGLRGAELTQQLLAFSRKQVAQLRPLNVNSLIRDSEGMLKRVIGEDVHLVITLDPAAGTIKGDRGQIHQVLMNLVVNGREAMPHGGTLTIETRNVYLGPNLQEEPCGPGVRPHLLLRIGDTGVGMDARTRQHLFEPFFTTKHLSKGTGLGLSTVFGIVTASGGHITVDSEPGHGSVFNVYLPHLAGPANPESAKTLRSRTARGSGAVLVVEDQEEVRKLTCMILRDLGYKVLEAADGAQALAAAGKYGKPIRLMLTDVIMPGMNGRQLAAQLAASQPRMKVVFMSGYTDRVMSDDGVLDSSMFFLEKPFTPDKLLEILHRALE